MSRGSSVATYDVCHAGQVVIGSHPRSVVQEELGRRGELELVARLVAGLHCRVLPDDTHLRCQLRIQVFSLPDHQLVAALLIGLVQLKAPRIALT